MRISMIGSDPRNEEPDEETLLRLIEKREKNLKRCNEKIMYYTSQMKCERSELDKLKALLKTVQSKVQSTKSALNPLSKKRKAESSSSGSESSSMESGLNSAPEEANPGPSKKPPLFVPAMLVAKSKPMPAVNQETSHRVIIDRQPMRVVNQETSQQVRIDRQPMRDVNQDTSQQVRIYRQPMRALNQETSHQVKMDMQSMPAVKQEPPSHQARIEEERQYEAVQSVGTSAKAVHLNFNSTNLIHGQHKKRPRCLELCPINDTMFASSGLDGAVNLWEVHNKGASATFVGSMDCLSPNQRKWPEDIAWHPDGQRIFAIHSADGGDSQVSYFNIAQLGRQKMPVFLEKKPHVRGNINRINFMPWRGQTSRFVTSGSDHAVVLWKEDEKEGCWSHDLLHNNHHTSAVMAAFGLQYKEAVLSVGQDKRVVLFDLVTGRTGIKFQLDSKCLNTLPSPCDSNLYLVQLGSPEKQLRLFDIREKPEEIHVCGWDHGKSELQSALINAAWSSDGWHISSGSNDPLIHIFDIRYNGQRPSQSVKGHSLRVFKAAWHSSLPLLISISSDQHIGMHKYL